MKKMEVQKELPFIKYFEDGFEPEKAIQGDSSVNIS
jgi:hypothetical protein